MEVQLHWREEEFRGEISLLLFLASVVFLFAREAGFSDARSEKAARESLVTSYFTRLRAIIGQVARRKMFIQKNANRNMGRARDDGN